MGEQVPGGQLGARLQRRVHHPVEGEEAEQDRQDHADPEEHLAAASSAPPGLRAHPGPGAHALLCDCLGAQVVSSVRLRMLPPTRQMYRNDTAITMMNVSTASDEPGPIKRFCVSC